MLSEYLRKFDFQKRMDILYGLMTLSAPAQRLEKFSEDVLCEINIIKRQYSNLLTIKILDKITNDFLKEKLLELDTNYLPAKVSKEVRVFVNKVHTEEKTIINVLSAKKDKTILVVNNDINIKEGSSWFFNKFKNVYEPSKIVNFDRDKFNKAPKVVLVSADDNLTKNQKKGGYKGQAF